MLKKECSGGHRAEINSSLACLYTYIDVVAVTNREGVNDTDGRDAAS